MLNEFKHSRKSVVIDYTKENAAKRQAAPFKRKPAPKAPQSLTRDTLPLADIIATLATGKTVILSDTCDILVEGVLLGFSLCHYAVLNKHGLVSVVSRNFSMDVPDFGDDEIALIKECAEALALQANNTLRRKVEAHRAATAAKEAAKAAAVAAKENTGEQND